MKKKVIWIIGSNSSGKTTQSRLLHQALQTKSKVIVSGQTADGISYCYTKFGQVGHVGAVNDNQCTGTDTLSNKDSVEVSYMMCLLDNDVQYVILDPIMSTGKYIDFIRVAQVKLYCFFLDFKTPEDNFLRVMSRREAKTGKFEELSEKTKENLTTKVRNFRSLYNRVKDKCDVKYCFDALDEKEKIYGKILSML